MDNSNKDKQSVSLPVLGMGNSYSYVLVIMASVVMGLYFNTLSPSIAGGDSGEIVAEGCQLGTAHPPGYPLITIIIYFITSAVKNLSFLSVHSLAYYINLFCSFCSSLAVLFIGFMVRMVIDYDELSSLSGSLFAMGMFAGSPLIWQYAITSEVFPLNTLFASIILWLVLHFSKTRKINVVLFGSFICGLALCNQHTIILYEVPLILWMLFLIRRYIYHHPILILKLLSCFILGLSLYLYLPLASILNPIPGSWGYINSFSGFLHHFLRKDYGTFQLFSGESGKNAEGFTFRTNAYLQDLSIDQGPQYIIPSLAALGIISWVINSFLNLVTKEKIETDLKTNKKPIENKANSKNQKIKKDQEVNLMLSEKDLISKTECNFTSIAFLFTQLFYIIVFHNLSNLPMKDKLLYGVHQRFWMQPNVLIFMWSGIGFSIIIQVINNTISLILQFIFRNKVKKNNNDRHKNIIFYLHSFIGIIGLIVSIIMIIQQINKLYTKIDQKDSFHFKNYASSILDVLPLNSVLLINYDQQWTSVRYLQQCEGFRKDITVINLSMMTYHWFQYKRSLYPNIKFPGTFCTYPGSSFIKTHKAFTLLDFLRANVNNHKVFIGGKINFPDPEITKEFDNIPIGLVEQYLPFHQSPNGTEYFINKKIEWAKIGSYLNTLPSEDKYPEETWEWTIGRDFKDRILETSAYFLLSAIKVADVDSSPLVNAVYWLESAYLLDGVNCSTSLLKNAGLSHVHMIQNKLLSSNKKLKVPKDIFNSLEAMGWPKTKDWKSWCTDHFRFYWGEFLKRSDANKDPQFKTIKQMYEAVISSSTSQSH